MSTEAAVQFFDKLKEDAQLEQEIVQAVEGKDDQSSRETITELAATKGYEFTTDELWAEMQNRMKDIEQRQEAGEELTDKELEFVSGGSFTLGIAAGGAWLAGITLFK